MSPNGNKGIAPENRQELITEAIYLIMELDESKISLAFEMTRSAFDEHK